MLRNKKNLQFIIFLTMGLLALVSCYIGLSGTVWSRMDWQVLDFLHKQVVQLGYGPKLSSQIVYVTITDETYDYFGKNILDRADLAELNKALSVLGTEGVAYDIIFARPSNSDSDNSFKETIEHLGNVYLPIGFECSRMDRPFNWKEGFAYERFRSDYLQKPIDKGSSSPFYATRALMQADPFMEAAFNSGHISAFSDSDGVYRHAIMLLKVGDRYIPTLALSMFLDYARVSFGEVIVKWGDKIIIPAVKGSFLDDDVVIPIDESGRVIIPFAQKWDRGFKKMSAHKLIEYMKDENLRGNITEFFEGNFVFIGDVAVGTSDLGSTPLETDVPLIVMHTSLINGMLTNTFYGKWETYHVFLIILIIGIVIGFSAFPKPLWVLYGTGPVLLLSTLGLTWVQFVQFSLFPIATVSINTLFIFSGLVLGLKWAIYRDRTFIRNAFAKYVPEKVVGQLLNNPKLLRLGGEERVVTVLFSDIEGFTTISEGMKPAKLAKLLNEYLTEMTNIVMDEGGIIDKYEGDAIMAEFGVPLPFDNHADKAVRCGLRMLKRLAEMRQTWKKEGLPEFRCRVGINTGPMVVGNMGSDQVFDYTVLGDAVNLASRLEGANKLYGTYLMISEFTHSNLSPGVFKSRVLDVIKVKCSTTIIFSLQRQLEFPFLQFSNSPTLL